MRNLKKMYPESRISLWVAPRGTRAIAEAIPAVDVVIEASPKNSPAGHFRQIWDLAARRFDTGFMLYPGQLWKGAAYMYLAGIKNRIGHEYFFSSNMNSKFLLNHAVPVQEKTHDIEQNLNLLAGLVPELSMPGHADYMLEIPEANKQKAKNILTEKVNVQPDKTLVGIHPGSSEELMFKRWPLDNFVAVAKNLIEKQNAHILIFGGPDEDEIKQAANRELGENSTVISTDLLTTAAVMQHCRQFISNDSGLMHTSAAVGVKTLGLFGPTDEEKIGPRGAHTQTVRAPGTKAIYSVENIENYGKKTHKSLMQLTPEMVLAKLEI